MSKLIGYHNDPAIKAKYIARVKAHQEADEIIQGKYWENGKGCAVGCTLHSSDHSAYEAELGVPRMIARLEDGIFEGLQYSDAKLFPLRFLEAVKTGSDLSMVAPKFMHWLLVDSDDGVINFANTNRTKKSIKRVASLYKRKIAGDEVGQEEWGDAAADADAASDAYAAAYAYADADADAGAARAADAAADAADAAAAEAYAGDDDAAGAYAGAYAETAARNAARADAEMGTYIVLGADQNTQNLMENNTFQTDRIVNALGGEVGKLGRSAGALGLKGRAGDTRKGEMMRDPGKDLFVRGVPRLHAVTPPAGPPLLPVASPGFVGPLAPPAPFVGPPAPRPKNTTVAMSGSWGQKTRKMGEVLAGMGDEMDMLIDNIDNNMENSGGRGGSIDNVTFA